MTLILNIPYINPKMVDDFFAKNIYLKNEHVNLIDNRSDNRGISAIYNEIIDNHIHDDCWLFFLHEDFEIKQQIPDLNKISPHAIYGTFGVEQHNGVPIGYGRHICSNKDGSEAETVGVPISLPTQVSTLDCQSILIHTSLLRKFPRLRFDRRLTFDLYAEDLCINGYFHHGVPIMVLPLKFQHYSKGKVTNRYWKGISHLSQKYPNIGVAGPCSFIGGSVAHLEQNFTYDIPANRQMDRV